MAFNYQQSRTLLLCIWRYCVKATFAGMFFISNVHHKLHVLQMPVGHRGGNSSLSAGVWPQMHVYEEVPIFVSLFHLGDVCQGLLRLAFFWYSFTLIIYMQMA